MTEVVIVFQPLYWCWFFVRVFFIHPIVCHSEHKWGISTAYDETCDRGSEESPVVIKFFLCKCCPLVCLLLFFLTKKVEQKSQGKRECSAALPGKRTVVSMHLLLVASYLNLSFLCYFTEMHCFYSTSEQIILKTNLRCILLAIFLWEYLLNQAQNKALQFYLIPFLQTFVMTQRLIACSFNASMPARKVKGNTSASSFLR